MTDSIYILIAFSILIWGLSRLPKCDEPYDKWNYSFEYDENGKPIMTRKYYAESRDKTKNKR